MDTILLVLGFICVVVGIFGSFLPALPGPGLSWLGLLFLYLTKAIPNNYWILGITLLVTLIVMVLDYVIPAKGTKRFGGSSYGVWGTNIGMLVGLLFIPIPLGFIVGAFLGAFLGEWYFAKKDTQKALKAASGSFLGFLASSFMKLVVCVVFFGTYVWIVIANWEQLF